MCHTVTKTSCVAAALSGMKMGHCDQTTREMIDGSCAIVKHSYIHSTTDSGVPIVGTCTNVETPSAVECRTLDRENTVMNSLHIGAVDGDSLWHCYAKTKQNCCTVMPRYNAPRYNADRL